MVVIGVLRIRLHISQSQSLKDKRSVVKSLLAQIQRQFQVSAGEVDDLDLRQLATLGITCVSTESAHADQVLARIVGFVQTRLVDAELLDYETEILHAF